MQRIDWFESRNFARILDPQNMIGMHHLRHVIKSFDLARHNTALPRWQLLGKVITAGMEKHKLEGRLAIRHVNAIRAATRRGRIMIANCHLNGRNGGWDNITNTRLLPTIDTRKRQRHQQVSGS